MGSKVIRISWLKLRRGSIVKNQPYEIFLLFVVVVWIIGISLLSKSFLTIDNLLIIAHRMSENCIVAIGMTFVILSGGIDLSVGSIMALTISIGGMLFLNGLSIWIAFVIGICLGVSFGFLNGLLVVKVKLQPIIATLATMIIARSISYGITLGKSVGGFPPSFNFIGQGYISRLPFPFLLMILLIILGSFVLHRTRLGRYIYAVGGNEKAAFALGINISKIKLFVYLFSSLMASCAGIIYASRVGAANPAVGKTTPLDVITAVLIGGTSITGGKGRIFGTIIGVFLITSLINGLHLIEMGAYWQIIFVGGSFAACGKFGK